MESQSEARLQDLARHLISTMVWVLNLVATFQILLVTLVPSQTLSTRKSTAKWSWRAKDSKSSKSRGFKRGKWASDFKILTLPNSARPIGIYQNAVSMWTDWSSRVFDYFLSWLRNMTRGYNPLISMLCSVSMAPIKNVTGSHTLHQG